MKKTIGAYEIAYNHNAKNERQLVVVFSHSHVDFALKSFDFGTSRLDIRESGVSYFTEQFNKISRVLIQLCRKQRIENVVFVGASKGGFGALIHAHCLSERLPSVRVTVLAFSPQTQVFPFNPSLRFPSYRRLIAKAQKDRKTLRSLQARGKVRPIKYRQNNIRIELYFGSKNEVDRNEAHRIGSFRVKRIAIPIKTHLSIVPYLCDTRDPESIKRVVGTLSGRARNDKDLQDALQQFGGVDMIEELSSLKVEDNITKIVQSKLNSGEKTVSLLFRDILSFVVDFVRYRSRLGNMKINNG